MEPREKERESKEKKDRDAISCQSEELDETGYTSVISDDIRGHEARRHWRQNIIVAFLIVSLILGALFFLPIPLGNIRIQGSKVLTVKDIVAVGGLSEPVNILQVNTKQLEKRLQQDLRIEKAVVTYELPLTIAVHIEDRRAVAVVMTQFGYISLDKNGKVIKLGPAIEDTNVPILSGVRLGNILLGDKITNSSIINGVEFLKHLTPEGLINLSELNVGDPKFMIAYTLDGIPLHIGDSSNLAEKAKLSEEMLKDMKARKMDALYIDVNITSPFIKVR